MSFEFTITPEMTRQFVSEVTEHLDTFEKTLLAFERDPSDQDAVNAAFRAIHSIKGNSDYFGLRDMNTLADALEDLMDDLRKGRVAILSPILSLLLEGEDLLRDMNRRVTRDEHYEERDLSSILQRIQDVKTTLPHEIAAPLHARETLDISTVFARSAAQHVAYIRERAERIQSGGSARHAKQAVLRSLTTLFTSANYAGFTEIAALVGEMRERVTQARSVRKGLSRYLCETIGDVDVRLAAIKNRSAPSTTSESGTETRHSARPELVEGAVEEPELSDASDTRRADAALTLDELSQEIKVAPERVDALMNQVTELLIAKNTLNYLAGPIAAHDGSDWTRELKQTAATIDKLSGTLQTDVMQLRLVKIKTLFERLPRIVRDLSLKNARKVELSVSGAEMEIDRTVVEYLVDPIIHLIRNAVDHGIESPEQRVAAGKADMGRIGVEARQKGNYAIIDVYDDGRGLDVDAIKGEALHRELMNNDALDSMSEEEILNLIFEPGYSSASASSRVSGRGVGLDIVKNNMNAIGGNVTLLNTPGEGIRVSLQVPLTTSVIDVLITEAAGELYGVPLSSILETMTVTRGEIQVLNAREVIPYTGNVLRLRHLRGILGTDGNTKLRGKGSDEELAVIVMAFGGQIYGVVVDRILRQEAIVAKPLEHPLSTIKELSGAAILGDGSIVFILNPMGML